jgi:hypothetical protein
MSVVERLSARVAFMDSLGPDVKTVPESAGEDDRALLALVKADIAADAAAHAVAKYEKAFDDGADITAGEYRKRVDDLNKSLDAALKTRRTALEAVTRGE